MKNILLLIAVIGISHTTTSFASQIVKETIYTGKVNLKDFRSSLLVSKFYETKLNQDHSHSFQYTLKPELKNEDFKAGIYQASSFNLIPSITSKQAISHKTDFTRTGEFKLTGEIISFEGELSIDQQKIGTVKYEFNMYDLPIRRIYNPKVTRGLENTNDGFIIVENREI